MLDLVGGSCRLGLKQGFPHPLFSLMCSVHSFPLLPPGISSSLLPPPPKPLTSLKGRNPGLEQPLGRMVPCGQPRACPKHLAVMSGPEVAPEHQPPPGFSCTSKRGHTVGSSRNTRHHHLVSWACGPRCHQSSASWERSQVHKGIGHVLGKWGRRDTRMVALVQVALLCLAGEMPVFLTTKTWCS